MAEDRQLSQSITAPKANGFLIWHKFQDQTSIATVITPQKPMDKLGLNEMWNMETTSSS